MRKGAGGAFELLDAKIRASKKGIDRSSSIRNVPASKEDLPPGWVRMESRSKPGQFYYAHPATGRTQVERPGPPQGRPAQPNQPQPVATRVAPATGSASGSSHGAGGASNKNGAEKPTESDADLQEKTRKRNEERKAAEEEKKKKLEEEARRRAEEEAEEDAAREALLRKAREKRKAEEDARKRAEEELEEEEAEKKDAKRRAKTVKEKREDIEAGPLGDKSDPVDAVDRATSAPSEPAEETEKERKTGTKEALAGRRAEWAKEKFEKKKAWQEDDASSEDDADVTQEDIEKWKADEERRERELIEAEKRRKEDAIRQKEEAERKKREEIEEMTRREQEYEEALEEEARKKADEKKKQLLGAALNAQLMAEIKELDDSDDQPEVAPQSPAEPDSKRPRVDGGSGQPDEKKAGVILWYNGRRQTGMLMDRHGQSLKIPQGGAPNGALAPPTPGGLMHGTRVSYVVSARFGGEPSCFDVRPLDGQVGLTVGGDSKPGRRASNEDRLLAADLPDGLGHMVCVFDGHRGTNCVNYLAGNLPQALVTGIRQSLSPCLRPDLGISEEVDRIRQGLAAGFESLDSTYLSAAQQQGWGDGASGLVTLVVHGFDDGPDIGSTVRELSDGGTAKLFIAWCGTSRAIVLHGRSGIRCTEDHVCAREDEYARLQRAGANLFQDAKGLWCMGRADQPLVAHAAQQGMLSATGPKQYTVASRGFGDLGLKEPLEKKLMVATPEVKVWDLSPEDWGCVLAGRGISSVLTEQDIAWSVYDSMAVKGKGSVEASQALTDLALLKGATDNLTCIVLRFGWAQPPSTPSPALPAAATAASACQLPPQHMAGHPSQQMPLPTPQQYPAPQPMPGRPPHQMPLPTPQQHPAPQPMPGRPPHQMPLPAPQTIPTLQHLASHPPQQMPLPTPQSLATPPPQPSLAPASQLQHPKQPMPQSLQARVAAPPLGGPAASPVARPPYVPPPPPPPARASVQPATGDQWQSWEGGPPGGSSTSGNPGRPATADQWQSSADRRLAALRGGQPSWEGGPPGGSSTSNPGRPATADQWQSWDSAPQGRPPTSGNSGRPATADQWQSWESDAASYSRPAADQWKAPGHGDDWWQNTEADQWGTDGHGDDWWQNTGYSDHSWS